MKTLQRYLLGQVMASLVLTAGVFTAVLLFGNVLREILPLLMSGRVTVSLIAKAFALLIPFVWAFALPMGMLTATLLVFGRFSADQELTAARASGVSLLSLVAPIIGLSLVLCFISAAVNMEIAPRCRVAYNRLRYDVRDLLLGMQLPEGRPIRHFPGHVLYIGKSRKGQLEDIRIYSFKGNSDFLESKTTAARGEIRVNNQNQTVTLHLYDCEVMWISESDLRPANSDDLVYTLNLDDVQKAAKEPGINDMTFLELRQELREVEKRLNAPLALAAKAATDEGVRSDSRKPAREVTERIRIQMHRQVAFSFACFGFTLIGIPLGIRAHRRETNIGIAITLGLVAVYYGMIVVGESLSGRPELAPHLLMWAPNFLFQAAGMVLLWRANRGA